MADERREVGALGEHYAAQLLERHGYRILERNFRTREGELDLIAADGSYIVFCEVKTRVAPGRGASRGLDSIGFRKRRRIRLLALCWLSARQAGVDRPAKPGLRFDAIGVDLDRAGRLQRIEHVENAF